MFRETRRPQRALTEAETWALLKRSEFGILAMTGAEGYPYAVPMNHVVADGALLFHAAVVGHRLEALRANPRVCFTVTEGPEEADAVPEGSLGTYSSAVVFGEIAELPPERHAAALVALCRRLAPTRAAEAERFVQSGAKVSILRLEIAHLSGKRLLVK